MTPTLTPQAFVDKWRYMELKERAACQEHFIDLCRLLEHPTPAEADPTGEHFAFEYGAAKQDGGQGFADVFKRGYFGWEYKGKHANLAKAYGQLLQYRSDLQNPPLLVVCDMDRIVIHTNFTNTVHKVTTLTLADLLTTEGLKQLRAIFTEPDFFKVAQTTEQVTRQAAEEFARLAELLRQYGVAPQAAAHFLIRILFCLFSEDVGLLPDRLLTRLVTQARQHPKSFAPQVQQLFQTMSTGGFFGADEIKFFDGRLFDNAVVLELGADSLDILRRVSTLDWANIEPSIFGTLFVRSLDPSRRSQLGAQYTSKEDILLILEPVLMAPLRRKWAEIQAQAHDLAAQRKIATGARQAAHPRTARDMGKRTKLDKQLRDLLIGFATELATISVLDPACGSGNFLYLALVLLLDLWKEVSNLLAELGFSRLMPTSDVAPSPLQLHGIEKDEYAHELAQTTIWIGYIQWFIQNGFGFPPEPILRPIDTVTRMDAILDPSGFGNPKGLEPIWPAVDVIVGNPPFLGGKRLRAELGDEYVEALFALYNDRVPHECDLVSYWFEKARAMIAEGKVKRVGLLATQAIRGGANREVLKHIKETGNIFWAQSDREWILDGAAVRVSMIGFDDGRENIRELDGQKTAQINADLTSTTDLTAARRLTENRSLSFMGVTPVGAFNIPQATAQAWQSLPNPNRRSNRDVLRPFLNGQDITGHSREEWIVDFGVRMPMEEAAQYEAPFEYVKQHVKPQRDQNNRAAYRDRWWIFAESRPAMREAIQGLTRYIATPAVAKHRLFVWMTNNTIPDHRLQVIARDDDYFLGVLHSRLHEVWSLATSSRHGVGNDPTYNNTTCFETFPFPWPPGQEPSQTRRVSENPSGLEQEHAIADAARELVQLRDAWLNPPGASEADLTPSGPPAQSAGHGQKRTLTNLYNARPTWLDNAHRKLDAAVFAAYGWPSDLSDDEILARLLALNLERAAHN